MFDFLASIGGEHYSRDVLIKVAESYAGQAEWERSNEAFRFLIKMDPDVDQERRVPARHRPELDERARRRARAGRDQGPARQLRPGDELGEGAAQPRRARPLAAITEELVRVTATNIHAEAQRREKLMKLPKQNGCATKPIGNSDLATLYTKAADAYEQYLAAFGGAKTAAEQVDRAALLPRRHPVLQARQGRGRRRRVPRRSARARRSASTTRTRCSTRWPRSRRRAPRTPPAARKLYDVDKKFGEAIDLYATLFPADPTLVGVIFKNGQMFYDYGEYDEAIKRFGVIVTKYPKDPNAGPPVTASSTALNKAQDYENIEDWARKLKSAPAFAAKDQQDRLDTPDRRVDPEERRQVRRRRQVRAGRDVLPARPEGDPRREGRARRR